MMVVFFLVPRVSLGTPLQRLCLVSVYTLSREAEPLEEHSQGDPGNEECCWLFVFFWFPGSPWERGNPVSGSVNFVRE
jgi:hypothetical protein